MALYYAMTDENGVLCVDQVANQSESLCQRLAKDHRYAIYFIVDNAVPEFRVPS